MLGVIDAEVVGTTERGHRNQSSSHSEAKIAESAVDFQVLFR